MSSDLPLTALEPELIGGLFGRKPSLIESSFIGRIQPRARFTMLAIVALATIAVVAKIDHGLIKPKGVPTALDLFVGPSGTPALVGLPLLQDPVGLIAIVMTLAAPLFCSEQVRAIRGFNSMNERNIAYRIKDLDSEKVNSFTDRANNRFRFIGGRTVSAFLLLLSAALSFAIDYLIKRWGLFASWNHTLLPRATWRTEVYAGWWANPMKHLPLAIILWCLGSYFFYFLLKQLFMGAVFSLFVRRVMSYDFGVSPNMTTNSDGHWGLRLLRHFMLMTYASTLANFILIISILVIWLPFGAFTILMVVATMIIDGFVVIYPSVIALTGAVNEKICFVAHVGKSNHTRAERDALIDKVWNTPNLPFKIRSTVTAVTLYLLIPLLLALVSSLLGR